MSSLVKRTKELQNKYKNKITEYFLLFVLDMFFLIPTFYRLFGEGVFSARSTHLRTHLEFIQETKMKDCTPWRITSWQQSYTVRQQTNKIRRKRNVKFSLSIATCRETHRMPFVACKWSQKWRKKWNHDEDGIRTHAGRAQWISSPLP